MAYKCWFPRRKAACSLISASLGRASTRHHYHTTPAFTFEFTINRMDKSMGSHTVYASLFSAQTKQPLQVLPGTSFPANFFSPAAKTFIPAIGFGTFQPDPDSPPGVAKSAVLLAIKEGYRHIDTAYSYGPSGLVEKEVGEALRECGVPLSEFFIVTKLACQYHGLDDIEAAYEESLRNLGLEERGVDLLLMHFPHAYVSVPFGAPPLLNQHGKLVIDYDMTARYTQVWKKMEELHQARRVAHIGLSNFSMKKIQEILAEAAVKPAALQIELHPYFPQNELLQFCSENGIHVTAHSPLGGCPVPAVATGVPSPIKDPLIFELAEKYKSTPAQVLLGWALERGTSVVPKSNNPARIASNLRPTQLTKADYVAVNRLSKGIAGRRNNPKNFIGFDIYDEDQELEKD